MMKGTKMNTNETLIAAQKRGLAVSKFYANPTNRERMSAAGKKALADATKPYVLQCWALPKPETAELIANLPKPESAVLDHPGAGLVWSMTCHSLQEGADAIAAFGLVNSRGKMYAPRKFSDWMRPCRQRRPEGGVGTDNPLPSASSGLFLWDHGPIKPHKRNRDRILVGIHADRLLWLKFIYTDTTYADPGVNDKRKPCFLIDANGAETPHKSIMHAAFYIKANTPYYSTPRTIHGNLRQVIGNSNARYGYRIRLATEEEAEAITNGKYTAPKNEAHNDGR